MVVRFFYGSVFFTWRGLIWFGLFISTFFGRFSALKYFVCFGRGGPRVGGVVASRTVVAERGPGVSGQLPGWGSPMLLHSFATIRVMGVVRVVLSKVDVTSATVLVNGLELGGAMDAVIPAIAMVPAVGEVMETGLLSIVVLYLSSSLYLFVFLVFLLQCFYCPCCGA